MTSSEYRLPALPFGRSEATILRWLKQPGEQVAVGDPLMIVVNDCAEVALPASLAGLLTEHLLAENAVAAADAPLAVFAPTAPAVFAGERRSIEPPHRVTPVARRVAHAGELDPLGLSGTGVSGRVTKADVLAALAPPRDTTADLSPAAPPLPHMRAPTPIEPGSETSVLTAIAVDLGRVVATRARLHADFLRRGLVLTDTVCVMAALAATLPRHPLLNGSWYADAILIRRRINLALMVGARHMLVHDAQDLNIRGLARALQRPPESAIEDSTFTIVEYEGPVWWGMPALAVRHSATLGIGAAQARPAVVSHNGVDRVAVRPMLLLSLVYDARVLDQCQADVFLHDLKAQLEQFSG